MSNSHLRRPEAVGFVQNLLSGHEFEFLKGNAYDASNRAKNRAASKPTHLREGKNNSELDRHVTVVRLLCFNFVWNTLRRRVDRLTESTRQSGLLQGLNMRVTLLKPIAPTICAGNFVTRSIILMEFESSAVPEQ